MMIFDRRRNQRRIALGLFLLGAVVGTGSALAGLPEERPVASLIMKDRTDPGVHRNGQRQDREARLLVTQDAEGKLHFYGSGVLYNGPVAKHYIPELGPPNPYAPKELSATVTKFFPNFEQSPLEAEVRLFDGRHLKFRLHGETRDGDVLRHVHPASVRIVGSAEPRIEIPEYTAPKNPGADYKEFVVRDNWERFRRDPRNLPDSVPETVPERKVAKGPLQSGGGE